MRTKEEIEKDLNEYSGQGGTLGLWNILLEILLDIRELMRSKS